MTLRAGVSTWRFAIVAYEFNPYRFTSGPSSGCKPMGGPLLLQSLLINLALGYPFSLLYTAAFTCLLLLLWRYLPRGQKRCSASVRW